MPPRRPQSTSNVSPSNTTIARAPTASPQLKKQFALSLDSIYQNNLNVIKRRDPSIVSILDQFSHVCLYSFNGKTKKWERQGYEGSIFIVEHRDTPIYGFYILNRLGTGDYSRRIYPEDDVEVLGNYLMYRYYPAFTEKRTAMALPFPLPPQFCASFDLEFAKDHSMPDEPESAPKPNPQQPYKAKKGTSITLGLWQFPQDGRSDTIKEVMLRLHRYVKLAQPYPEQFRYGPGRPPPPPTPSNQLDLNNPPATNGHSHEFVQAHHHNAHVGVVQNQIGSGSNGVSEVDKLFAKLQPSPTTLAAASAAAAPSSGSVQNWFAALTGEEANHSQTISTPIITQAQSAVAPPATSTRGLALLDSIFASVSHPAEPVPLLNQYPPFSHTIPQQPQQLPSQPEEIQIVSPKPQSSALPQILTQNVISTLLGLGPNSASSRASSAALSSNSSHRSVNKRYEGDNELSENEVVSDSGLSASSTVLNAVVDPAILASGSSHLDVPSASYSGVNGRIHGSPSIQGDVTPRAGARGIGSTSPIPGGQPPVLSLTSLMSTATLNTAAPANVPTPVMTPNRHPTAASAAQRAQNLVPFSADSELWPYPRAPLNDNELSSEPDVVELDFSDTRALSDPSLFKEKQSKQSKGGEKRKKSKKERAAERQKEREAIENGWDDPTKGQVTDNSSQPSSAHTRSLSLSTLMQSAVGQQVNGRDSPASNGTVHSAVHVNGISSSDPADIARHALLGALSVHPNAPARELSRKQFVQEVLNLIYTDKSFVDKLYEEYNSPAR